MVRSVYGSKMATLWQLLREWGPRASVVLLAQLAPVAQRRLATILRQLALGPVACGSVARKQLLIFSPNELRGVSLPHVQYAVYLHALLDPDGSCRQLAEWALPPTVRVHRLCLRQTVEELLTPTLLTHVPGT
jgi:hypothetical protein